MIMVTQYQSADPAEQSGETWAERILDSAIRQAELNSWESVRLHHIANELGITLEDVYRVYRQKDDLVEAWYDRADRAMLSDATGPDYQQLSPRERIHRSIMCWLGAMEKHRRISRDMLMYKFELGHVHLQVLGLLRISRTVQWILESAHRDAIHLQRVIEETTVTSIYLASFGHWMFDNSPHSEKTRQLLDRLLRRAEGLARFLQPLREQKYASAAQTTETESATNRPSKGPGAVQ
ncbi:MAG: TetR/AcrR family transcriptional regulator [gamma proteobacterium endosymbiont of Lamellibrachia anaximandri]|nr:TetR/AcrR family transcriptional regulator [gamma proteobacterium endosymbiont of Lamellibrachia anaximandri]